ncbi:MAG: flagellar biosynthesis protein FlhB [Rickettsiales bacterium]
MADDSHDDSSKTEEPTQKKLDDARKKGQTISTRELNHFFIMLALATFIYMLSARTGIGILELLSPYITKPEEFPTEAGGIKDALSHAVIGAAFVMALPLFVTFVAAFAPAVVQGKWIFSTEQIKPKWSKISPLSGFSRLFGWKAMIEFLKNAIKVTIVGTAAVMVALPARNEMVRLMEVDRTGMLLFTQHVAGKMLISACIFLFFLSIIDYIYQRFIFLKSQRMTKQEVKEEYKQQEGDPHVKGKVRQIRRERAKKRMMANVPKADVIITNPTHYAVALQYDANTMPAPKVVAKGADDVAARIRELATKNKVPIVRNPPLARILYETAELDEVIPLAHYQAVAKIIGYVYKLKGKVPQKPPTKPTGKGIKMPTINLKK